MPQKTISLSNLTKFKQELDSTYGQANQPAKLDSQGKVPQAQLPSEVYNVLEYGTFSAFPQEGEANKLYIDKSTNNMYRWETNAYVSVSAPESIKYIEQELTEEQKAQARQNIDALAAEELPDDILRYNEQTLTEEQQAQARANIGAASPSDIPTGVVRYDEEQQLEGEEKVQARSNIGAASATEVSGLSNTVGQLSDRLNNFGNFVRKVEESDNGIKVTYDNNQIENIETGLVFDGGYVDDNNYLYLKHGDTILPDDVFTPVKLPEGGGGGSAIALTNVVKVNTVRNGKDAIFGFTVTTSDDSDVTVKWYVNDSKDPYVTEVKGSGSSFSFNAKNYLNPSASNSVSVFIESGGGSSLSRKWSVTTVAFAVTWGNAINPIMLYTTNANIYVPINVSAEANTNNVVTLTIGSHVITRNVTGSQTLTVEVSKDYFVAGKNVLVAGMYSSLDPEDKADDIQFTAIWGYGATTPIITFAKDYDECTQYDVYNIEYFAFDPENELASCTIKIGDGDPVSVSAARRMQVYQYSPLVEETITIKLTCQSVETTMTLKVNKSDYDLSYYKDDSLQYDLNPVGHSNTDADREQFAGLTFSQNFDWENGGFQNDTDGVRALVIKKGNSVILPRSLFGDSDANGKTVDISFKVTNSDQYDAVAMQDLNNGMSKGIILKANNGEVRLNNIVGQEFRYSEENRVDMSILVENVVDQRISTIWLDGIPSKVNEYSANMLVQSENNMVIGSEHCDVWIYNIRVYNAQLNRKQMMQNYVSNGINTEDKVDRYKLNTILGAGDPTSPVLLESISPTDLHTAVPNLTIVQINADRMTVSKEDPVPALITITDGGTVLELPAASAPDAKDGCLFKVQGTSSAAYGRSSYNLDLDFKGTGKKYKISENAIAVNYINIKVNVASSECANNINCVDWYNTYQPYITVPRQKPGVRDTVEGKPCAVFFTNTSNTAQWFSSQLVQPGATILYAMGDICNSKKNKDVFGQDGNGEHHTLCCIEVSGNDTEPERFRNTDAEYNDDDGEWDTYIDNPDGTKKKVKHFEWRMEPKGDYIDETSEKYVSVQAWNELVAWVVSTIDNPAKFKDEASRYFAVQSMLYHFLFLEYFACYDNVSKNTFYSYDWDEDEQKYLWNIKAAYDMDTVLAADNDGKPYGDYGIDYGDTENGRSYFNAVDNPIWVNIKAAYQSELSTLYNTLRSAGCWNSNDIVSKWDVYQSRRPHAAMMMDAFIKYVLPYKTTGVIINGEEKSYDDSYLPRMQGSKTYWRKQFLTYQTSYMDGKYGIASTTNSIAWRTNCESSTRNYAIKSYAKTYITVLVDSQRVASVKVGTGEEKVFENISVGTNTTLYVKPDRLVQYIRPLDNTKNSTFVASGATKMTEAILGGDDVNTSWPSGTGVNIPSVLLKDLSIRNMTNFTSALNLAANVELETVDARNTSAGSVVLPSFAPLKSIQLNSSTAIEAHNLNAVETFTMESGNNLESIIVDNCNNVFNTAIATYLTQATNTQIAATRRIRAVAIRWSFSNLNVLYKIATSWKGYNNLGEEQEKPVVTGMAHVTSLSKKKLEAIHAMWGTGSIEDALDEENKVYTAPNLIITYDVIIPYYAVTFKNIDNSPIKDKKGNDYVQYVDMADEAYDPIAAGEVNTPTYIDPEGQYLYVFTGWDNLEGAVYEEKDVTALYSSSVITYTVRWYDKVGGTLYYTCEVEYGKEAIYDPDGTIGYPTNTEMEVANTYNLFTGWDKSTGYIRENTDVYATWSTGQMPTKGTPMNEMNVAQIYGITKITPTKSSSANVYFDDTTGDSYTDITVGRDFEFSNVPSALLMSERFFNGDEMYKMTDVKLFDANAGNFTLAIDYEFSRADNNATIVCCCDNSTGDGEGFRVFYKPADNSINVRWGDQVDVIGYGLNHGIVVLRHRKGSKNLYVASNYGGRSYNLPYWENQYGMDKPNSSSMSDEIRYGAYYQTMHTKELARAQETSTNNGLTFGAIPIGDYGKSSPAKGWIHWCKIWYDDLGVTAIKEMANWPRETWRMQYRGMNLYNRADSTGWNDGASFIASAPLDQVYEMYPLNQIDTTGGWTNSPLRAFINDRCFKALPYSWQQLVKTMNIKTKGGADKPTTMEYTSDKMYIPSGSDMADNMPEYVRDESTRIKWFTDNFDRPKYLGIKVGENANIITDTATDPTLLTETYTIKEGDVWYPTGQSGYYIKSYVYISADTAAKYGIKGGRAIDNINNIAASGAQGGYWIGSFTYWTRSNPTTASSNREYHYTVYPSGAVSRKAYILESYSKNRGVVLMFSI